MWHYNPVECTLGVLFDPNCEILNTCLIIICYYIYVCRIKKEMINWKLLIIIETLILNLYTFVPLDRPKLLKGNGNRWKYPVINWKIKRIFKQIISKNVRQNGKNSTDIVSILKKTRIFCNSSITFQHKLILLTSFLQSDLRIINDIWDSNNLNFKSLLIYTITMVY